MILTVRPLFYRIIHIDTHGRGLTDPFSKLGKNGVKGVDALPLLL